MRRITHETVRVVYNQQDLRVAVIRLPESIRLSWEVAAAIERELKQVVVLGGTVEVREDRVIVNGDGSEMGMNPTIQKVLEVIFRHVYDRPRESMEVGMYFEGLPESA